MTFADQLVLGTAQWGIAYGVANRMGRPPPGEVAAILAEARAAGITTLDTARAYGDAERVIGSHAADGWRVVTKLGPDVAAPGVGREEARERARTSLMKSRRSLRRERLDAVLLHRPDHREASGGGAWDVLQSERRAGRIGAIGVSVVAVDEAAGLLDDAEIEIVQVPASLLDRRLHGAGFFAKALGRGVDVMVRSIFLQGVAHLSPDELPTHLSAFRPVLRHLDHVAAEHGVSRPQLFMSWARHRLGGARLVIGCETRTQLRANVEAWRRDDLGHFVDRVEADLPDLPEELLDPWRWPVPG